MLRHEALHPLHRNYFRCPTIGRTFNCVSHCGAAPHHIRPCRWWTHGEPANPAELARCDFWLRPRSEHTPTKVTTPSVAGNVMPEEVRVPFLLGVARVRLEPHDPAFDYEQGLGRSCDNPDVVAAVSANAECGTGAEPLWFHG